MTNGHAARVDRLRERLEARGFRLIETAAAASRYFISTPNGLITNKGFPLVLREAEEWEAHRD